MVAPSPKKTAQFDQTSQHKKEPSAAQLKRRSKPARTNLAKPKETFNEYNEFQGTQGPNRKRSAKSQSESTILDAEREANNGKGDTAEDVNLAEVDEYFDNFMKNNEGISCPQAPQRKKKKKKAKNGPSSVPNPASYFQGKQNGIDNEDEDFQGAYDDKKKTEKVNTSASNSNLHIDKLCYKLKNARKTKHFRLADGKIECPFCGIFAKNVMLHFQRKQECGEKINLDHFVTIHKEYKKENERNKHRIRVQNYNCKQKETNQEAFRKKTEPDPAEKKR
jgi:hypothetical protein